MASGREKRRDVPLSAIPQRMVQAVLAIEDRRFYDIPGSIRSGSPARLSATCSAVKKYMRGGSTITQQLVKNTFLTPEKTLKRKLSEWFMSVALERRLTKDQILTLYLNDVSLGQRGSFAIHGVPEAARLFFSKDVTNVSLSEAATHRRRDPVALAPVAVQQPRAATDRRNVVLHAMADCRLHHCRCRRPRRRMSRCSSAPRALDAEAPYFVDYISQELQDNTELRHTGAVDVYTTLDLHMQRIAQDAVRDGLAQVDELLAKRKRQRAQAALIAVDPRTGETARAHRRPHLQPVAVQPRDRRASPAGLGVQAVRLSRRFRASRSPKDAPTDAGQRRHRRTDLVHLQRAGLGRRATTTASSKGRSRCDARSRSRATLRRSRSRRRPDTTRLPALWQRSAPARRRGPILQSRSACSKRRPSKSRAPTRSFPNGGTIKPLRAISQDRQRPEGRAAAGPDRPRTSRARTRRFWSPT